MSTNDTSEVGEESI